MAKNRIETLPAEIGDCILLVGKLAARGEQCVIFDGTRILAFNAALSVPNQIIRKRSLRVTTDYVLFDKSCCVWSSYRDICAHNK